MLSNEAKYTSSYKFFNLLVQFVALKGRPLSRKRPSNVLSVWGRLIERVGRSKLIQTNLTEPDVQPFMNLTHLMKSSTFSLGLTPTEYVFVGALDGAIYITIPRPYLHCSWSPGLWHPSHFEAEFSAFVAVNIRYG